MVEKWDLNSHREIENDRKTNGYNEAINWIDLSRYDTMDRPMHRGKWTKT